ncbi:MAG TPA: filamentous hemagglutinin N-terminal domain-containing protein, partial [Nitrospiraceae bacterium]|nr:filamentous hemagglutinin N-terminal domain-containing protein [Nitrospiraceae bacterium]
MLTIALVALQLWVSTLALALPTNGQVVAGQATIQHTSPTSLSILQSTDKAILNWNSFSIAANEAVRFYQPSIYSIALNRVLGIDPSVILGQLQANGRIFLINPNGILFGAGAQINVGGLLATTLQIKDGDFMAGRYLFAQDPLKGLRSVVNNGTIHVSDHGFVYLIAPGVANDGVILANLGSVLLGSAQKATIDLMGDGLIKYVLSDKVASQVLGPDGKPLTSAVSNSGTIQADGGHVILSARASGDVFESVINQSGIIRARSLVNHGGVILLEGSDPVQNTGALGWQQHLGEVKNADGRVINTGTLDVSAAEPGAAQGEVTLSGQMVGVAGSILARGADNANGGNVLATSSKETIVATGAVIDTSGVGNSSAGNTVIWSDQNTAFRGTILANGGQTGGNGGQIEASGHNLLEFTGQINALAPHGVTGSVLLDPTNITVANGGTATLPQVSLFANPDCVPGGCTIAPATINGAAATVNLQANNDITITNAIAMTGAGIGINMRAGRDINVNAGVATNNGAISMTANDSGAGAGRLAGDGSITGAGAINAGTSTVTLTIGTNAGGGGGINLTGAVTGTSLAVDSAKTVSITNPANNVGTIAGRTTVAGEAFSYTDANALNITTIGALTGVSTNNGPITLTTTNGNLTVTNTAAAADVNAGTSTVALTVGGSNTLTLNANSNVTGTGGITYTADTMTLSNSSTTTATGAIATLQPNSAGRGITLGANVGGTLSLTSARLNTITAGILRVGSVTSGNMAISGAIAPAGTTTLSLISGGTITQTAAITETNLAVTSVGAVTLNNAANTVNTLAANVTGAGNAISYTGLTSAAATPLTIGTVDGINGITAAGNVAVTTNTARALTVAQPITTTNNGTVTLTNAGTLALNADITADGAVTQNGAGAVTTTGTRTITTTNDAVSILQPVTLGGDLTITSG